MTSAARSARAWPRRALLRATALAGLLAGGCTTPIPQGPATQPRHWSGRLSVVVDTDPPRQFFAGFELNGSATSGQLLLLNPLGSALALLRWTPAEATLQRAGNTEHYASIAQLAEAATGAAIPVTAMFDWLHGEPAPVDGWQADLGSLARGQLRAERTRPLPRVSLRVLLEPD